MAVPIQLEIFMKDLTKNGLVSVAKNVEGAEQETLSLIKALQEVRAEYVRALNANKEAGKSYQQEAAMVQALTGQIKGLKEGLKELQKAKQQTCETPMVNPNTTVDMDTVARKTNNLRMQFSQVARELPSLAMGPQMFILAISNNLPMLSDAIADVRKQNELLKASGQKAVPVWKQLASSLFSWQTALVAGISFLIVYGNDMIEWVKNLTKAKKELTETEKLQQAVNTAHREGGMAALEESAKLRILYTATQDTRKSINERNKAVDELQKMYPDYFGKLTDEAILAGKAASAYDDLTKAIIRKGQAQAAENIVADYTKKNFQLQRGINADTNWTNRNKVEYEKALKEAERMWENYRNINQGSFFIDKAARNWISSTKEGKLIEEYERRMSNIKKYTDEIAKNNKIIEGTVNQIDTSTYLDDALDGNNSRSTQVKKDYATELAEARLRAEQIVERLRIQLMQEGIEKRKALARQEYDEQKADIDRQEQETLAKMDAARKQGDTVTDSQYEQVRQNANQQRILQQQVLNRKLADIDREYQEQAIEAQIAYNKQYGTYAEQRASIIAEGLRKAAKAESDGARDLILRQTEDALKELDFSHFKDSINFAEVFGQLDMQTTESLTTLRDKLKEYINNAASELDPEDLKELQDAFKDIDLELMIRQPFKELNASIKELALANKELEQAEQMLNKVERGEIVADDALEKYNQAKEKAAQANLRFVKAENAAKNSVDKLSSSLQEIGNTIGGQGGEIISLIGNIGLFATTTIDGISRVTQTGADAISAVEKASVILGIISSAIRILQKMGELGTNKSFEQYETYAQKINEINALTEAVNQYSVAVAEAAIAENGWFSTDNLRSLRDYKKLQSEVFKEYISKAMEAQAIYQNKSGGGWLTGAFNWIMGNMSILSWWDKWKDIWGQGDYAEGTTAAINNLRIETRKASSGFLGTGIGGHSQQTEDLVTWAREQGLGDLFDENGLINKELAQALIDNYGNKLVGQTKETLEELIKLREKYDEYIEQLHEYVSSLYEPLVNNFVDSLWDWFDEGKSALDSFKEYASGTFRDIVSDMLKTIVLENVVGSFGDDIASIYEKYASGLISEKELMQMVADRTEGLINNYETNIPALQEILQNVSNMLKEAGIDLKDYTNSAGIDQSPQSGALTTMSQDSISTFEGIGRSVQTHLISIDKVVQEIRQAGKEDSEALMQIVANTSHLLPIRELLEKFDREGIKMQ